MYLVNQKSSSPHLVHWRTPPLAGQRAFSSPKQLLQVSLQSLSRRQRRPCKESRSDRCGKLATLDTAQHPTADDVHIKRVYLHVFLLAVHVPGFEVCTPTGQEVVVGVPLNAGGGRRGGRGGEGQGCQCNVKSKDQEFKRNCTVCLCACVCMYAYESA